MAYRAFEAALESGSVAICAFHGSECRACDAGDHGGSDDHFLHFVCFVDGVDSRFPLPCHRRMEHDAACGPVDTSASWAGGLSWATDGSLR